MAERLNYAKAFPEGIAALVRLGHTVNHAGSSGLAGLDPRLLELVKIRASQLNECAYCIDMHSKDARALGESEQRLYALAAWRDTPFFTPRERAALTWTEAITNIQEGHASDDAYEQVRPAFSEPELAQLTLAIAVINVWNRLMISSRAEVGAYEPNRPREAPSATLR